MKFKLLTTCAITLMVTSCASVTPLQPNADKVIIIKANPPASCHLLKALTLQTENGVDMPYTSHENIQTNQLNQLRNSTANLGGNLFVIRDHEVTHQVITLRRKGMAANQNNVKETDNNSVVNNHAINGDAYFCAPDVLATLNHNPSPDHT